VCVYVYVCKFIYITYQCVKHKNVYIQWNSYI